MVSVGSWLESCLKNRKQHVILPGHFSSVRTITRGVPQGLTLRPLLSLLYINGLQSSFSKSVASNSFCKYIAKKLGTIESVISNELKFLVQWLPSNILSLNETKAELIIFKSTVKNVPCESYVRINNCKLKLQSHTKYLGILFNGVLPWNKQIDNICINLAEAINMLF